MAEETHSYCPSARERIAKDPIVYFRSQCALHVRGLGSEIRACVRRPALVGGALLASRRWPAQRLRVHAESMRPPLAAPAPSAARTSTAAGQRRPLPRNSCHWRVWPCRPQVLLHRHRCRASVGTRGICKHHKRDARRTLRGICVEGFGRCDADLLQEIRRLNPGLSDLDHIEPGQKIRFPVLEADPEELVC